jgi:phage terminase large subunit-like protein
MRPFTVPHIRDWARSSLILDTGEPFELEPFQIAFLRDVFRGYAESWLVVPEGNAKTTLAGALVLYHAQFTKYGRIPVAASSRDQALWLYQAAAGFVERSEALERVFRCQEGYRRIRCDSTGSRIQIFAADDRTGDGVIPTLCVLEELHRHRDLSLYRTWRGKLEKRGGQLVAISTGGEPEGEFETVRKRMRDEATEVRRRGCYLRAASETTVLHEYAVPDEGDPLDLSLVLKANPLKMIDRAMLKRKLESPAMTPPHWRRFVCGQAARAEQWIEGSVWDPLRVDIGALEEGDRVVVGIRVGAGVWIGIVAPREGERVAVGIEDILRPESGRVSFRVIEYRLQDLCERYDVIEIDYDPEQLGTAADVLIEAGLPMEEVGQRAQRLAKATSTFWRLVSSGLLMHDGDEDLRRQVLAGQTKETVGGWRLDPTAETNALIALVVAAHEATKIGTAPPEVIAL